jgi:hypothetical protein
VTGSIRFNKMLPDDTEELRTFLDDAEKEASEKKE